MKSRITGSADGHNYNNLMSVTRTPAAARALVGLITELTKSVLERNPGLGAPAVRSALKDLVYRCIDPIEKTLQLDGLPREHEWLRDALIPSEWARIGECAHLDGLQVPEAGIDVSRWERLIVGRELAEIRHGGVDDAQAPGVAALCLKYATSDEAPERLAVTLLLGANPNVRAAAESLLKRTGTQGDGAQKEALALCYLEAGYALPESDLAVKVRVLRKERMDASAADWASKAAEHQEVRKRGPGVPFHRSDLRLKDHNGRFNAPDNPEDKLVCRHLEAAADFDTRKALDEFIETMAAGDVSALSYEELQQATRMRYYEASINASHDQFGRLVVRIAKQQEQEPGKICSYPVEWIARNGGHCLRLYVQRQVDGRVWAAVYNSSGGRLAEVTEFPEVLARLGFDLFERTKERQRVGCAVVSVGVKGAPGLAASCTNEFVNSDVDSLVGSIATAMKFGNIPELDGALSRLKASGENLTENQLATLGHGLFCCMTFGHAASVQRFLAGLKELGLKRGAVSKIFGQPSSSHLSTGMVLGHSEAVESFLKGAKDLGWTRGDVPGLLLMGLMHSQDEGDAATVAKCLAGLKGFGMTEDDIVELVADGLRRALMKGHAETVGACLAGISGLGFTGARIAEIVGYGLADAVANGRTETVKACLTGLKGFGLADDIVGLVADGLERALMKGNAGAVRACLAGLSGLGLSGARIAEIVGTGLADALAKGRANTVKACLTGLKGHGLAAEQIKGAIGDGLCVALTKGHADAVYQLLVGLPGIGLNPQEIANIAVAEDAGHAPGVSFALRNGDEATVYAFVAGLEEAGASIEPTLRLLTQPRADGDNLLRSLFRTRSAETLEGLSCMMTVACDRGVMGKAAAKQLLSAVRAAQGKRPWYTLGMLRVNFGSTGALKAHQDAYAGFKAAKRQLKLAAKQAGP